MVCWDLKVGTSTIRTFNAFSIKGFFFFFLILNFSVCLLQGVPYIIYWKNAFSCYAACHFRHSLLSVVQRYNHI